MCCWLKGNNLHFIQSAPRWMRSLRGGWCIYSASCFTTITFRFHKPCSAVRTGVCVWGGGGNSPVHRKSAMSPTHWRGPMSLRGLVLVGKLSAESGAALRAARPHAADLHLRQTSVRHHLLSHKRAVLFWQEMVILKNANAGGELMWVFFYFNSNKTDIGWIWANGPRVRKTNPRSPKLGTSLPKHLTDSKKNQAPRSSKS